MTEKLTTTINNVYQKGSKDFAEFQAMVNSYKTFKDTDIKVMRKKHKIFGDYLEKFYTDCQKVKLTRDQIAELVTEHFPGLTTFDRSAYRAYSEDYEAIIAYAESVNSLSVHPRRLLNIWQTANKQAKIKAKLAEAKKTGIAVDPKTGEPEKVINKTQNKIIGEVKMKSGITPDEPSRIVTPVEAIQHFIASGNAIIQHFNADKYNADQLNEIERFITNILNHINSPNVMDQIFEKSEKKVKVAK